MSKAGDLIAKMKEEKLLTEKTVFDTKFVVDDEKDMNKKHTEKINKKAKFAFVTPFTGGRDFGAELVLSDDPDEVDFKETEDKTNSRFLTLNLRDREDTIRVDLPDKKIKSASFTADEDGDVLLSFDV